MSVDLSNLWDHSKPELSEERFRAALLGASADDALILQTQIARTHGIRGNFAQAQQILNQITPQIEHASLEAQARYHLELGRTYASATHPPESQTSEAKAQARSAYMRAFKLAQDAKLDDLAIDSLHMMSVVDTAPEDQLTWNYKALTLMEASSQQNAKDWAGSLHNNNGYALYLLGRYEDALAEFKHALAAHEQGGNLQAIRIAHWMVAWTLRALGQINEALEIQLRLERENDSAGEPDAYVFEELEHLYSALQNNEKADFYAARRKATT